MVLGCDKMDNLIVEKNKNNKDSQKGKVTPKKFKKKNFFVRKGEPLGTLTKLSHVRMNNLILNFRAWMLLLIEFKSIYFSSSSFTGHNSPLYPRPEDNIEDTHPGYYFNVFNSIHHWLDRGKSILDYKLFTSIYRKIGGGLSYCLWIQDCSLFQEMLYRTVIYNKIVVTIIFKNYLIYLHVTCDFHLQRKIQQDRT